MGCFEVRRAAVNGEVRAFPAQVPREENLLHYFFLN